METTTDRMPAVYLGHGAPPLVDDELWVSQLKQWATDLPTPTSILVVSAHWESAPVSISTSRPTELVYDFGGFHPMYYRMRYDTPDASDLARSVASLMPDSEPLHEHGTRGLDHGAWVPLKIMYPDADIPVLQLSMPTHDPARLLELVLELGRRLRSLRQEGVLVVGKAPALQYAHPTVEHYTPLFVTLGAAADPEQSVQPTIDGYIWGLSKRSFQAA